MADGEEDRVVRDAAEVMRETEDGPIVVDGWERLSACLKEWSEGTSIWSKGIRRWSRDVHRWSRDVRTTEVGILCVSEDTVVDELGADGDVGASLVGRAFRLKDVVKRYRRAKGLLPTRDVE